MFRALCPPKCQYYQQDCITVFSNHVFETRPRRSSIQLNLAFIKKWHIYYFVFFYKTKIYEMKWNESGFRPPLCTYRLNWARRTSWGWWDDWDDTDLQTQDSKFEPWRSEAEHVTSRSRRLPTILTFTRGWGRNRRDWEPNPELWRERQRC